MTLPRHRFIFIGVLSILFFSVQSLCAQTTTLVSVGSNGKLVYAPDAKGNKVPDYSGVGYMNSEAPIPTVPVVLTAGMAKLFALASLYNASNSLPCKTPDLYLFIV